MSGGQIVAQVGSTMTFAALGFNWGTVTFGVRSHTIPNGTNVWGDSLKIDLTGTFPILP